MRIQSTPRRTSNAAWINERNLLKGWVVAGKRTRCIPSLVVCHSSGGHKYTCACRMRENAYGGCELGLQL